MAPRVESEIATIGYEGSNVELFLQALREAGIDLVVDVRAVANSRRPGFAKTMLAANLAAVGIDYLHLRGLGTPAEGRAAARGKKLDLLREIYSAHLTTTAAQVDLHELADLVRANRSVCLLCLEADPRDCHRSMVADVLNDLVPVRIRHLRAD